MADALSLEVKNALKANGINHNPRRPQDTLSFLHGRAASQVHRQHSYIRMLCMRTAVHDKADSDLTFDRFRRLEDFLHLQMKHRRSCPVALYRQDT